MSLTLRTRPSPLIKTTALQSRYLSSTITPTPTTNDTKTPPPKSCPITGLPPPQLKHMPSLPFFGSTLNHLFTNDPPFDTTKLYQDMKNEREKYGLFFSTGFPGFGTGLHGTFYNICNPDDMLKVIRAEGAYPSGVVQMLWTFISALRKDGSAMMAGDDNGLLGQGERWKSQRSFLQTGMLDPRAARGYLPGILKAAQVASGGAVEWRHDVNRYLNLCAFDMFGTFMLGDFTGCASAQEEGRERSEEEEENVRFCHAAIDAMEKATSLGRMPYEIIMNKLGIETKGYADFYASWSVVREIGMRKLNRFVEKYERGELNEFERASYLANALSRLEDEGEDGVSKEEMLELCLFALFVGVDTTSGVTAWNLVHLALNPHVQDKLYDELSTAMKATGESSTTDDSSTQQLTITPRTLEKKHTPYLHNILRETYRLTPPFGNIAFKRASRSSFTINDITLPQNSMVVLNNVYNDPTYLPDAQLFKPERWSPDAIAARKNSNEETMDHALFRDSFGQGARRCPGSRVATNEVLGMLAQLVWDYEIRMPEGVERLEDVEYDMSALVTPKIPMLEFRKRR